MTGEINRPIGQEHTIQPTTKINHSTMIVRSLSQLFELFIIVGPAVWGTFASPPLLRYTSTRASIHNQDSDRPEQRTTSAPDNTCMGTVGVESLGCRNGFGNVARKRQCWCNTPCAPLDCEPGRVATISQLRGVYIHVSQLIKTHRSPARTTSCFGLPASVHVPRGMDKNMTCSKCLLMVRRCC